MASTRDPHRLALIFSLLFALGGCANSTSRAHLFASRHGFHSAVLQGTQFQHQIFEIRGAPIEALYVFIDGDGLPWTDAGTRIARDPTPHRLLALELATRTPHAVLYLGRPCYFRVQSGAPCGPDMWTDRRYSREVVDSMAAALNRFADGAGYKKVILVGYSGGGTLAALMAPHVPATRMLVTIAANLDVAEWTRWHHYWSLDGSLDPASEPPLAAAIEQWHLIGGRDTNVPEAVNRRYFNGVSPDRIWRFPEFDHACCWVKQWPQILARLDGADLSLQSLRVRIDHMPMRARETN
jgi:hypothetical protein